MTNYNETINRFKETDCGKFGKAFEINVKHYLNGNRGNSDTVSAKGKTDCTHKGNKFEIKSNCGELDGIEKNDYIIYTMDNKNDFDKPQNAKVIPPKDFLSLLNNLGLVRTKKSTNGYMKTTIQSYANSKKKYNGLAEALSGYPTLEQVFAR